MTETDVSAWNPQLVASLPTRLRTTTAIDPANIRAVATVQGVDIDLQQNSSGQYVGQVVVAADTDISVSIRFFEIFDNNDLTLATATRGITTGTNETTLALQQSDYITNSYDADGDTVSNLLEREAGTNPFDSNEQPGQVSVEVLAFSPLRASINAFLDFQIRVAIGSDVFLTDPGVLIASHTFTVSQQNQLTVEVSIIETQTGQQLTIARQSQQISDVQNQQSVVIAATGYDFEFDQDNDSINNLDELISGSDPLTEETQTCTPVTQKIPFTLTDDAYVDNSGQLSNGTQLRIEFDNRVGLVRFLSDVFSGTTTNAELVLVGGSDEGSGLISIYALPDFAWNDVTGQLSLPALGNPVSQIDGDWNEDEEYRFFLDSTSITSDITLAIRQDSDDNDLAFESSDGFSPPMLQVTVQRCE